MNGVPGSSGFLEVLYGANSSELNGSLANGSKILKDSMLAPGSVVNGVQYEVPTIVASDIFVDGTAIIAHTSRIAIGSWIEEGSILNGMQWANGMKASGIDAVLPLSEIDIAPILYIRTYTIVEKKWTSYWNKYTYKDIYPNATSFDAKIWKHWITEQIDALNIENEFREKIIADISYSLNKENHVWNYPSSGDPNMLFEFGAWMLDNAYPTVPNKVFDTRCYVISHSREIGIKQIFVEPFKVVMDESGEILDYISSHNPVLIYDKGTAIHPQFIAEVFEYFNFDVVPGNVYNEDTQQHGAGYVITYDVRLVPEKKNLNSKVAMERLLFTIYSDDFGVSNELIASFEKFVSLNVQDMLDAPFVIGARTRTGITSTGQLGDPLYDLGCMEISEDSIALKLRKKSVTMQSEIKNTMSLIFERRTKENEVDSNEEYDGLPDEQMTLRPSLGNTIDIGTAKSQFRNLYLSGSPIISSDKTLKADISEFPNALMKKWSKIKWISFKFKDAIDEKGDEARIHAGVVAQDVKKALRGVDIDRWSFFCKDQWNDEKEYEWIDVPAGKDEFGVWRKAHTERRISTAQKAGERYSIRYQEMQAIENAYLRKEIELLKEEIKLLKQKVN